MQEKKGTEISPFVPLNVRAFVECDVFERSVILALNYWHWQEGEDEGPGIEPLAALAKISIRQTTRVLGTLKEKGWVEAKRSWGAKTKYRLSIEEMSFKEARKESDKWIEEACQNEKDSQATQASSVTPTRPNHDASQAMLISKDLDLKDSEVKRKTQNLPEGRHPEWQSFIDAYFSAFKNRHQKNPIPSPGDFRNLKTFLKANSTLEEFRARLENYFRAAWLTGHTLTQFCTQWDKWVEAERKTFSEQKHGYSKPTGQIPQSALWDTPERPMPKPS